MTGRSRAGGRLLATLGLALVAGGCSTGRSPVEACVEHSVEEGVGRAEARAACEEAVGEER